MPYATITMVTTATATVAVSAAANLNWRGGKPTTLSALTTASSGDFTIQYTLDDLQLIGGTSLAYWSNLSTDPYTTLPSTQVAGIHYTASNIGTDGVLAFIPGSIGAVRLNSSSFFGPVTLKVMQGEGW